MYVFIIFELSVPEISIVPRIFMYEFFYLVLRIFGEKGYESFTLET